MKTIEYENQELKEVAEIAKQNGYRVFGFQKDTPISQIFVVSKNNQIGTVSATFGGVSYGTVHKPCREFGAGFGISGYLQIDCASLDKIRECTTIIKPYWAGNGTVIKYRDWEEYTSGKINSILTYFEL